MRSRKSKLLGGAKRLWRGFWAPALAREARYCERCGEQMNKTAWAVVQYDTETGRPSSYERWWWCPTQIDEALPTQPAPMPLHGSVAGWQPPGSTAQGIWTKRIARSHKQVPETRKRVPANTYVISHKHDAIDPIESGGTA